MTVYSLNFQSFFEGDGATVDFVYGHQYDKLTDLRVRIVQASGSELFPSFNASGTGEGATITIIGYVPAVGDKGAIWRDTEATQEIDYKAGNFPSSVHEGGADKAMMLAQERKGIEALSLRFHVGSAPIPPLNPISVGYTLVALESGGFGEGPSAENIREVAAFLDAGGITAGTDLDYGLITHSSTAAEDWGALS